MALLLVKKRFLQLWQTSMAFFKFKALNELGKGISGEIEAESPEHAFELISLQGHIPESVKKTSGASKKKELSKKFEELFTPVKHKDIILYTMQLKTLLQAGVAIVQIFQIMEAQTENKRLRRITTEMKQNIRQGASFRGICAFAQRGAAFDGRHFRGPRLQLGYSRMAG